MSRSNPAGRESKPTRLSPVGRLLRHWRGQRGMSQLDLALDAEVSPRHLSFVETGRSEPSREMVLRLAESLDLPLREQNALLEAAGYAQMYRETEISDPEMAQIRRILEFLLERHEPYPAIVVDRHHNLLMANASALTFSSLFTGPKYDLEANINTVETVFDPEGMRPFLVNWEEVARALLNRVHREDQARERDAEKAKLLERILRFPGVPARWASPDLSAAPQLLIPMHLRRDDLEIRMFTTITTVGTPQDITLQELRVESFLPADEESEKALRELSATA
jgi:transcriptional regulator with XRE-family HTH domain